MLRKSINSAMRQNISLTHPVRDKEHDSEGGLNVSIWFIEETVRKHADLIEETEIVEFERQNLNAFWIECTVDI